MTRSRQTGVLVAILGVAAALRAWSLGFGLPAVYNPDEIAIMNRAVALPGNGFDPGNYLYPSLYFYLLFVVEGCLFAMGWVTGAYPSLAQFERAYFVDPTPIYLAARGASVVAGVATVWVTWRLGARLGGPRAGLVAALLLAVAPLAVRDAHYVKHDVPVTFLIVAAVAAAVAAHDSGRRWGWRLAGLAAGLACSTHYYAVFVAAPVVGLAALPASAGEPWRSRVRRIVEVGVATSLAFAITSPFLLVNPGRMLADMAANRAIVMDRVTESAGWFGSLAYYVTTLGTTGLGPVAALLAVIGARLAFVAGARARIALLLFPIVFLLFIANTFPASRYLNPLLPFGAVLGGLAASWLASGGQVRRWSGWAVVIAAVVHATLASSRASVLFGASDTRTLAREYIERTVPAGTSVLVQPYSVPLRQSRAALDEALTSHLGDVSRATVKFQRQRALDPYPEPSYRLVYLGVGGLDVDRLYVDPARFAAARTLEPLHLLAVTYVVLKRYNEPDGATAPLVEALGRQATLVRSFSPYRSDATPEQRAATPPFLHNTDVGIGAALERAGPIIDIWRLE